MKHEITIKVTVDTAEGVFKPSQTKIVSELSNRVEQARYATIFESVEVTSATIDSASFGKNETVADVSIEDAISVLATALIGNRAPQ